MGCPGTDSPCFIAGDDLAYDVTFTDSNDVAKDLTGATAKMDLRVSATDVDPVVKSMTGGIVTPTEGHMRFTLTDVETAALLPRATLSASWAFSVKLTYSDASEQTIMTGTLTLQQAATA